MTIPRHVPPTPRGWGWIRDLPDHRDHVVNLTALPKRPATLPSSMDLRPWFPSVWPQGETGACVGFAVSGIVASTYLGADPPRPEFRPSPAFAYFQGRLALGTVNYDSGSQIRDVVKATANVGICPESDWPYDAARVIRQRPSAAANRDAPPHRIVEYQSVPVNRDAILGVLAAWYPLVIGFQVMESMITDAVSRTGDVPMPSSREQVLGGHAVCLVGYDLGRDRIIFRNSWSTSWGDDGYGTFPVDFITSTRYADDCWLVLADALG